MSEVQLESLTKTYGDAPAVDSIDLTVKEGEFVTLLGPSGCGKTTTLRAIAGLVNPDAGRISIGGRVMADPARRQNVPPDKRDLGMVFQSYALWPHMTVAANVGYPLKLRRRSRQQIRERVDELLNTVGLLQHRGRMVTELSGGQQQRVALARALASGSKAVLYDEPLSNLDARLRATMRDEIRALHEKAGTTSIFVTHDQEEALVLADRVVVMNQGRIVQDGTPQEVYGAPADEFVARFLGFENVFPIRPTGEPERGKVIVSVGSGSGTTTLPTEIATAHGLAIKATHVRIGSAVHDGDGPTFIGTVTRKSYLGDRIALTVDAGSLEIQAVVFTHLIASTDVPEVDDTIPVQWPYPHLAPLNAVSAEG